nr:multicopper oxidase domain-containing protein [uncultured Fluviicola sp.]
MKKQVLIAMVVVMYFGAVAQKTVRYDLFVKDTTVNFTGKERPAYAVNGSIPMPELHFTEGDTAEIWVHNELKTETSIHWHGLILPNEQDGVPYLTTAPIKAGTTHLYKFPIVQNGTYWYHSHAGLQEQVGMYGAFIIHRRNEEVIPEYTMVLSDWTNMKPFEVHRRLHMANDWSAIKKAKVQKGAVQSYLDAIAAGSLKTKLGNEWKRMLAMDVSDVYYDKFLTNGKPEMQAPSFRAGEKVRIRIINGSSSTYFWMRWSGGKMEVVASDGMDVVPVPVDRFIIAVAETYDVMITIPSDSTSFELQATSEDRIRSTSLWIGTGVKQLISPLEPLKYFEGMQMMNDMIKMNGNLDDMGMNMSLQQMDMNVVMYPEITGAKKQKKHEHRQMDMTPNDDRYNSNAFSEIVTLNYNMLKSPLRTNLPDVKTTTYNFELTGNMNRYVWSIDNKTVSETDKILIKKGENVRIIIYNNSMMRHPMHLHGHFFRVVNGNGDFSPLKNVLDIMPMETDTIEFAATESGDWFFHCHILYHMMSGMGRIFSYENSPPNAQLPNPKKALRKLYADDREFHFMFQNDFATNGNDGEMMLQNTRWNLQVEWRLGYNSMMGYETEAHFGRYIGKMQWFMPYVGLDWRYRVMESGAVERNLFGQVNTHDRRTVVCAGIQYTLPMLIIADLRIDSDGKLRLQFMREDIPLTKRLRLGLMYNSDFEYMASLKYVLNKSFSLSAHYDSDMGFGGGFTFTY